MNLEHYIYFSNRFRLIFSTTKKKSFANFAMTSEKCTVYLFYYSNYNVTLILKIIKNDMFVYDLM